MNATVTREELKCLVPTLTPAQFRVLTKVVLRLDLNREPDAVSLLDQLKAGLYEFMMAVGFVSDSQAQAVLVQALPLLSRVAAAAVSPVDLEAFPAAVTFAEQRWVLPSGDDVWYDMQEFTTVEDLPAPPVLLVLCSLPALFVRQQSWLAKLRRGTDARPVDQHHAEAPPGAGGQGPPG